jgi:autotransporter-associated beta strand protein
MNTNFSTHEQTVSTRAFIALTIVFLFLACAIARGQSVEVGNRANANDENRDVAAAESFLHGGPGWFSDLLDRENFSFFARTPFFQHYTPRAVPTVSDSIAANTGATVEDPGVHYTPFDLSLVSGSYAAIAGATKIATTTSLADTDTTNATWSGGGTNFDWTTYANWVGAARPDGPSGSAQVHFGQFTGITTTPYNNYAAYSQFYQIDFDSTATASFTLNGNDIKLFTGNYAGGFEAGSFNNSSVTQTVNFASILTESATHFAANSGDLIISSPVYADFNDGTLYATAGSGHTLSFNGVLGQFNTTRSLNVSGPGTVVLNAANTYTGATTVTSGTLLVNNTTGSGTGTGDMAVNAGTLGGGGTISGAVAVASGANLSPGSIASTGTVGTLHTGSLTLSSGSNYLVDLTSGGVDLTAVTGSVTLTGSNLIVATQSGFTPTGNYVIISNDGTDPVTGVFGTTVVPAGYTVDYLYNDSNNSLAGGNDVALVPLTAVPEPSTWAGAALALVAVGVTQRRRFRRARR